ncbi:hypothetical protein Tsubulata_014560 [Turnera subulata]|uniref:Uncharacterized protein n=1 Tax=Turnera subulata TaxID=218843 RepID=A0A9Q0FGV8_9ROSI|nr:hypothetical protein Tsubulata_014560 [Turnera subulata]
MVVGSDGGVAGDGSGGDDADDEDDDDEDGDPNCVAMVLFLVEEELDVEVTHGLLPSHHDVFVLEVCMLVRDSYIFYGSDLWRSIVFGIEACIFREAELAVHRHLLDGELIKVGEGIQNRLDSVLGGNVHILIHIKEEHPLGHEPIPMQAIIDHHELVMEGMEFFRAWVDQSHDVVK